MNVQHILVPIDFSTCSLLVCQEAADLAGRLGARITLLHVSELPPGMSEHTSIQVEGRSVEAATWLRAGAAPDLAPFAAAVEARGVAVTTVVRVGPVVPSILTAAEGADLVIMGTHGRSGLARAVLGSVAEEIVHAGHTPVLLIRRERRPECAQTSCAWCTAGAHSRAEDRLDIERDG